MNETAYERYTRDKNYKIKAVFVLFSDGTIDVIDQITYGDITCSFDRSEEGINVLGKYHSFVVE